MTTRKYRLTQPTQINNPFDSIPPSVHQPNKIYIDLKAQRYSNDHSLSDDNNEQTSTVLPSKQQVKTSTVETLNNPDHMIRPITTYPTIEQPTPSKEKKKRICTRGCCNCYKSSSSSSYDLHSSKQYHHSSSAYSSDYSCFMCCYDDQSSYCACSGWDNSCLKCGCCSDGGCCDCDCGDCDCDCGDCDCSGCDF